MCPMKSESQGKFESKMKGMIVSVLLVAAVAVSEARSGTHFRYVTEGECPTITNKQDFDPVPYLGKWYEIERFNIIFQKGMDCVQAIYSDLGDGVVEVHNVARKADGNFTDIVGTAVVLEPGVLYVTFSGYIPAEYHVLDTDYESFSAVYNCLQLGPERFEYAWILSRSQTLEQETYDHARQVFANNGIDITAFHSTYQGDDCPYLR
ncbi:apolipoprotein D-like isoform X1 [Portunus trituberculatus]|uniref:apolipoprotein D-like isoform X1 n=2 Tax=Portunus trituberculatus TaxID=210409 RepID=UPI001E1CC783|nr:apolipoprotein D-like isoform X1 [Portunus trituberculatus]